MRWGWLLLGITMSIQANALEVAVSMAPLAWLVEQIGGHEVHVLTMARTGVEPEMYEPTPRQLQNLSKVQIYLALGLPFEQQWLSRLRAGSSMRVIDVGMLRPNEDPHLWLSVSRMKIIAQRMAAAMQASDAVHAALYQQRLQVLMLEISSLDRQLQQDFQDIPVEHRQFMLIHPSLTYFAEDYGLTQWVIAREDEEPSPRHIQELLRLARQAHLQVIFSEPQFSSRATQAIAEDLKLPVVPLDTLQENWPVMMQQLGLKLSASMRRSIP